MSNQSNQPISDADERSAKASAAQQAVRREEAHKTRLALELEKMEVARQAAEAQRVALLELAAMTKVGKKEWVSV